MMFSVIRWLLVTGFAFFVSACSNLAAPTSSNVSFNTPQTWVTRQYHQQIDISGRLFMKYEHNNQPQAIHVNFNWSQTPQQTEITLASPMGQTLAVILLSDKGAQLVQANKPTQFASDANQLVLAVLGWPLPINNLKNWLQGFINAVHYPALTSADFPANTFFTSDGWNLNYPVWQMEAAENKAERPKQLELKRQTEQAGLVSLRIVIDEWKPHDAHP